MSEEITDALHQHGPDGDVIAVHVRRGSNAEWQELTKEEYCTLMEMSVEDYDASVVAPFRELNGME